MKKENKKENKEKNTNHDESDHTVFFQSIVDNVPNMIFVKEAKELRFVLFNKAGEELLGYKREDMIGKNDYDFFPKDQADFFIAKDRTVLDEKILLDIPEEPLQTRLKGVRILHTKKIPILDDQGNPQYLLGISEDITDRMNVQKDLEKAHSNLEIKIDERTKELKDLTKGLDAANQQLKASNQQLKDANQELIDTEKTLKEKLRDLEVFNKATVGRELQMMELKKENDQLKKQIENI